MYNLLSAESQLRENRRHKLNGWLVSNSKDRWEGDDGRILRMDEYVFWETKIQAAQNCFFATIDAEYDLAKEAA